MELSEAIACLGAKGIYKGTYQIILLLSLMGTNFQRALKSHLHISGNFPSVSTTVY